jgi:Ca2+-binding RTX toxin-like protein
MFRSPRVGPGDHRAVASGEQSQTSLPRAVGVIQAATGSVSAFRDGRAVRIQTGDLVFEGDVIETGAEGAVIVRFYDGTTFDLSNNARIVFDKYFYDPDGTSNSIWLRIGRGIFSLIAGRVAETGDVWIDTPVSRIRGVARGGGTGALALTALCLAVMEELQAASLVIGPPNSANDPQGVLDSDVLTFKDLLHGTFTVTIDGREYELGDPELALVVRQSLAGITTEYVRHSSSQMTDLLALAAALHDIQMQGLSDPWVVAHAQPTGSAIQGSGGASPFSLPPVLHINFEPLQSAPPLPPEPSIAAFGPPPNQPPQLQQQQQQQQQQSSAPTLTISPTIKTDTGISATIAGGGLTKDNTLTLTGTVSDATQVSSLHVFDGMTDLGVATVDSAGNWTLTTGPLPDGPHTFTAVVTDISNTTISAGPVTATVDTTAPAGGSPVLIAASDSGASNHDGITDTAGPTFTIALGSTVQVGDTVELLLNGSPLPHDVTYTIAPADITAGHVSLTVTAGDLGADGNKSISALFVDAAGNSSTTMLSIFFDTTNPTDSFTTIHLTSDTGSSSSDFVTSNGAVHFEGSVADTGGAGIDTVKVYNGSTLLGTATVSGSTWSLDTTLPAGTYSALNVVATDLAGNSTTANDSQTVIVDQSNPTVVITSDHTSLTGDQTTATITFDFSELVTGFSSSDVSLTGGTLSTITESSTDPTVYTATFTAADGFVGTGSVSVNLGSYTDVAGNSGGAADSGAITINTVSDPNDFDSLGTPGDNTVGDPDAHQAQTIYGGTGNDTILGGTGTDTLYGGSGNDVINGNNGADTIYGGSGNDTINGGNGPDTIIGGYGADSLAGGSGNDTFKFLSVKDSSPGKYDTITDFDSGNDQLDFSAITGITTIQGATTGTTLDAHSIAWVINATNNTIDVYANTTDSAETIGATGATAPSMQVHLTNVTSLNSSHDILA